jgi:hypothetical protein
MSSSTEERLSLIPFEVFTQVAFEREFFRRQLLQCETALRRSAQLTDSLNHCLEYWDCSARLSTHSSDVTQSAKHRVAIAACLEIIVTFCDEILRKSHSELLLQCTSAAISEASDQAHTRAVALANATEARALTYSIELESVKSELAASQDRVSVLRRRADALEHLLDQERQQVPVQCMQQAQECASTVLLQSQALHDSMSQRIDALASKLKQVTVCLLQCCSADTWPFQNEARLARLRSSLQMSQVVRTLVHRCVACFEVLLQLTRLQLHSDRVQQGSDRSLVQL